MQLKHIMTDDRAWQPFDIVVSFESQIEAEDFVSACDNSTDNLLQRLGNFVEGASDDQQQQVSEHVLK